MTVWVEEGFVPNLLDVNTAGYAADWKIGEYPLPTMTPPKGMITGILIDGMGYHHSKNSLEGEPMAATKMTGHKMTEMFATPKKGRMSETNPEAEEEVPLPDGAAALVNWNEMIWCTVLLSANASDLKTPEMMYVILSVDGSNP